MIAQTGGGGGRTWFFIHDSAQVKPRTVEEAAETANACMRKYLTEKLQGYLPRFEVTQKDMIYMGQPSQPQIKKGVNYVHWFLCDTAICLSIQKEYYPDEPCPAMEPWPHEWFSWSQ